MADKTYQAPPKVAPNETITRRYFDGQNHPPKYKSRHRDTPGFSLTTNTRRLEDDKRHLTLSKIGTIRLHERANKLAYLLRHDARITRSASNSKETAGTLL